MSNSSRGTGGLSWPDDPSDAAVAPSAKPLQVKISVGLTALGASSFALLAVVFFMQYRAWNPTAGQQEQIRDTLKSLDQPAGSKDVAAAVERIGQSVLLLGIVFAVGTLLWLAMAFLINRGYRWTRAVATLLAILYGAFVIFTPPLRSALLAVIPGVIGLIAAGMLWMPRAREWLASARSGKSAKTGNTSKSGSLGKSGNPGKKTV